MPHDTVAYVGTYTRGDGDGIYVYRFDSSTGELELASTAGGVRNPSFLAVHPSGRFLYAVAEIGDFDGRPVGGVAAFAIDPETNSLSFINSESSGGGGPCHISIDATGEYALVANYGGGSAAILPVNDDGSLAPASDFVQHEGSSVHPNRQKEPHAHSINVDPNNRFVYVADLGLDKILIYALEPENGSIPPNDPPFAETHAGAGPRHFAFHPNGRHAYVINELDSTVIAYDFNAENGALTAFQTVPTLPDGFDGRSHTADIHVAADGRFVYGSNRGHDSIVIYSADTSTGELTLVGHEPTQGETPRNFGIDPSGKWLLAANQSSNNIVSFAMNGDSGELTPTGHAVETPSPVCVKFLRRS